MLFPLAKLSFYCCCLHVVQFLTWMGTNRSRATAWMLSWLEIPSAKEIGPSLKFSGQQSMSRSLPRHPANCPNPVPDRVLIALWTLVSWTTTVYISFGTLIFQTSSRMAAEICFWHSRAFQTQSAKLSCCSHKPVWKVYTNMVQSGLPQKCYTPHDNYRSSVAYPVVMIRCPKKRHWREKGNGIAHF